MRLTSIPFSNSACSFVRASTLTSTSSVVLGKVSLLVASSGAEKRNDRQVAKPPLLSDHPPAAAEAFYTRHTALLANIYWKRAEGGLSVAVVNNMGESVEACS